MSTVSIRISEDPARPLGHAIVTLIGLPHTLETFEFALRRHGFAANYLGRDGWRGAECWLRPEEAWYSGDALKVVIPPDLAFQLENMPYTLAVRGQGLSGTVTVTFVWPLELEIEDGAAHDERRLVGGTRVDTGPKPRPEPTVEPLLPPPLPLPEMDRADRKVPDIPIPTPIPAVNAGAPLSNDESPTRLTAYRLGEHSLPPGEEPTLQAPSPLVPPNPDDERRLVGGTRVDTGPKSRPGPTMEPPLPPPLPLPEVDRADRKTPDMPIPTMNAGAPLSNDESPTRLTPHRLEERSPPLDEESTPRAPDRPVPPAPDKDVDIGKWLKSALYKDSNIRIRSYAVAGKV